LPFYYHFHLLVPSPFILFFDDLPFPFHLFYLWFLQCLRTEHILFCKKKKKHTLVLSKSFLILISSKCYSFFINNIYAFVMFDGRVFQQIVSIHMGTKCALFLVDCFFYFYEVCCIQGVLKKNGKKLYTDPLIFLNFTFRYIDDVLSPKNSKFYFIELEIKDSKDTTTSASRLDIHIDIDGEGRFRTTKEIMSIFQMKSSLRTFYCRHRS
jgi:hypothetical protein